ncbi:sigma D regulator [Microbulbifer agarilyticus]|uniref:sigma D regulator n=1 Tax=Microbulbifer agarilyticus TaxID=260552 RepID=UPI001C96BCAC|nr:sigma D regulator [Microbulbifer agarilyticus]MBY6190971.1 sigma D regulator [Microbulbifer agarilyticus]
MLENCKNAQERWGGVSQIIDRWLQSRQALLVSFCQLSDHKEFSDGDKAAETSVRILCQQLVDYVSAGHFEVYDQLIQEGQAFGDTEGLQQAKALYREIDGTTDVAVDFNDKYQETDDLSALVQDLSELGVALETRFAAEDRMIDTLHTAHKNQLA